MVRAALIRPLVLVVAAALTDPSGRILLQKRHSRSEHGDLWEFPGGKVEPGEDPGGALVRELAEELGIVVQPSALTPLGFATSPDGAPRPIVILLYRCTDWSGEARCLDAQAIAWMLPEAMPGLAMPPLDIDLLRDALGLTI